MRRSTTTIVAALLFALLPAGGAFADHAGTQLSSPVSNPAQEFAQTVGDWEFIANFPLGPGAVQPLGVDTPFFQRDGKQYVLVSSITLGFRIFDITDPDAPTWAGDYGSTVACPTAIPAALLDDPGDALAAAQGWENDAMVSQADVDGVIGEGEVVGAGDFAVIGTDAGGRCHDPEHGGMEMVDISDPTAPTLRVLTRQTGENHNTSYDGWNDVFITDTSDGNALVDILDVRALRECLASDPAAPADCVYEVRYQFPAGSVSPAGVEEPSNDGCHDLTVREDRWYCAAPGGGTIVFDTSGLRAPDGTLTGSRLPCETVAAESPYASGDIVADCRLSEEEFTDAGLQSADLTPIAVVHHDTSAATDLDVSLPHEVDPVRGGDFMFVSDERGGGLTGPGCPGGGVFFYDLRPETLAAAPKDELGVPQAPALVLADDKGEVVTDADGAPKPGVFLTQNFPPGTSDDPSCTAHVMEQWGAENRIFLAWYHGGGHVVDFQIDMTKEPATIRFEEPGYESLIGAAGPQWSWTTAAYRARPNDDGTTTYWVVNADLQRGVDFLKVTLSPPPTNIVPDPEPSPSPTPTVTPPPADSGGAMPSTGGGLSLAALAATGLGVALKRRRGTGRVETDVT